MVSGSGANRVVLYGIGGLYNYGCEAIVRGTTALLRKIDRNVDITLYTPRAEEDAKQIGDLGIKVKQTNVQARPLIKRIVGRLSRIISVPYDSTNEDYAVVLNECDVLISIGGDIYIIPFYLRSRSRYPYFNKLVKMGDLAIGQGIREVVIGASVGPFGDYDKAVGYYAEHLRECELILCRESISKNYLKSIGVVQNVEIMPDPAFFVDEKDCLPSSVEAKYLGVNLSPLSLFELGGSVGEADYARLARLLQDLSSHTGLPLMLVPHVLSPDEKDNDLLFLRKLYEGLDDEYKQCSVVVEPRSFLDARDYLRQCKMVVAARMHCAINAICAGVPAIFLSYSTKANGMCEYVYGSRDWVVPLGEAELQLPKKLDVMLDQLIPLNELIKKRIGSIVDDVERDRAFSRFSQAITDSVKRP